MSSIPSHIAGSVGQSAIQQGQVARQRDAVRNHDDRAAEQVRRILNQHLEEVEDSAETADDRLRVREDEQQNGGQDGGARHDQDEDQVELGSVEANPPDGDASQPPDSADPADPGPHGHIDITV